MSLVKIFHYFLTSLFLRVSAACCLSLFNASVSLFFSARASLNWNFLPSDFIVSDFSAFYFLLSSSKNLSARFFLREAMSAPPATLGTSFFTIVSSSGSPSTQVASNTSPSFSSFPSPCLTPLRNLPL